MVDAWLAAAGAGLVALTALLVWLVVQSVAGHPLTAPPAASLQPDSVAAARSNNGVGGGGGGGDQADALVFVYRHGCPACKPLFPIIDALFAAHGANRVRRVVSTSDREFVRANGIERVPTVGALNTQSNKIVALFAGPRTQAAIETFGRDHGLW